MAHLVQRSGKAVATEKTNFAQTCNLLSQYLKERGSFGNITYGITSKPEANKGPEASRTPATTLNLLPSMENPAENSSRQDYVPSTNIKPMELFPQLVGFSSQNPVEGSTNKAADLRKSSKGDSTTAQMTIFYGGQVMVFDDFPAEKAKEIIALASKGTSNTTNGFTTASAVEKANQSAIAPPPNKVREGLQLRPQADDSDLPIARRASLHRFFEKRKDRAAAKAPYQINNPSSSPPPPPPPRPRHEGERNIVFIDLECQTSEQQLDLKL
ncbi:protein TIFY 10B [Ricinus communis]|uniref:Protein TIFY n=1 Tax=Ricinus communis TaxID=3988 RepID=B9ST81_RICCO|nr:protein TIFY 10B [Ricinus communis]EEF33214.1 conserved hypothetical protein [Ricinus communis]|eukprot:XP_002529200.1 protein TIFY 10B [Ricinus communis]